MLYCCIIFGCLGFSPVMADELPPNTGVSGGASSHHPSLRTLGTTALGTVRLLSSIGASTSIALADAAFSALESTLTSAAVNNQGNVHPAITATLESASASCRSLKRTTTQTIHATSMALDTHLREVRRVISTPESAESSYNTLAAFVRLVADNASTSVDASTSYAAVATAVVAVAAVQSSHGALQPGQVGRATPPSTPSPIRNNLHLYNNLAHFGPSLAVSIAAYGMLGAQTVTRKTRSTERHYEINPLFSGEFADFVASAIEGVAREDVIFCEEDAGPFRPAHVAVVCRSATQRVLFVAVRGTLSPGDIVTDLDCELVRMGGSSEGRWHSGVLKSARNLFDSLALPLAAAIEKEGNIDTVIFTGHSLGGAVASALCSRFREAEATMPSILRNARAYAFGPAACCDAATAEACREHTISVIVGDDIVPRLSRQSVEDVLRAASALAAEPRSIGRMLSLVPWSEALRSTLGLVSPRPTFQATNEDGSMSDRECFERSIRSTLSAVMHSDDRVHPPGICLWAPPALDAPANRPTSQRRDHRSAQTCRVNVDAMYEVPLTSFEELVLSPAAIADHQPIAYDNALLIDECFVRGNEL